MKCRRIFKFEDYLTDVSDEATLFCFQQSAKQPHNFQFFIGSSNLEMQKNSDNIVDNHLPDLRDMVWQIFTDVMATDVPRSHFPHEKFWTSPPLPPHVQAKLACQCKGWLQNPFALVRLSVAANLCSRLAVQLS